MPLFLLILWLSQTTAVPEGVILEKGAVPSASDAATPLPEEGGIGEGRYRNAYFGLSYPIPAGWIEQPAGPPPSETGSYVLTQFALMDGERVKAHVLVSAQDLFFVPFEAAAAKDVVARTRTMVQEQYVFDAGPDQVTIAGRTFERLAYKGRRAKLQWRMFTTDTRCHALTFTFTGSDTAALDAAEKALGNLVLDGDAPACVHDYARAHLVQRTTPTFNQRFNTIPVRVIIDAEGKVKHAHVLSAFPEQSEPILKALREWRFAPYVVGGRAVEVETGLVFGRPSRVVR
ncbi:MAG TPA: hypothetical protein VF266_16730 [Thermoanaerobaculia bacterium]